jgi:MFS family permease
MTDTPLRFSAIVALLLAGVFAGAQLGKIAPLVDWYRDGIGLSLVTIGWLTSMIGIFVALIALPAGWVIGAGGLGRSFRWSAVCLVLGGIGLALFEAPLLVLAARLVEGLGYLALVIALPAILSDISLPRWRGPVLAMWGGFVAAGFATADFLARWIVPAAGQRPYLLVVVLGFALFAALGALLLSRLAPGAGEDAARRGAVGRPGIGATLGIEVVIAALAFGLYVILSVGFFAFMPAYAADGPGLLLSAGSVALLVPIGNVLASLFVRGGDSRLAALLAATGFAVSALVAVPAFAGSDPLMVTLAAAAFAVAGGVTASALFAAIPFLVPRGGSVAVAIGLVAQTGGIGTVLGPPLAGYVIETHGWPGFAWMLVATALAGFVATLPLLRRRGADRYAV